MPRGHLRMRHRGGDVDIEFMGDLTEIERGRTGDIRIGVAADGLALLRRFQRMQHFAGPSPVARARTFQVRDHHRHARVPADPAGFVHGAEDALELRAQVRGVQRAGRRQRLGQFHHFLGGGGDGVAIGQPGRQAQGAMLERLAQLPAHRIDLRGGGRAVEPVHVVLAQRRMADQGRDVHCRLCARDGVDIGGEAGIGEGVGRAEQGHRIRRRAAEADRRRADAAVADDHRGHALRELGQHLGCANHMEIVVRVHIDEAGCERLAGAVEFFRAAPAVVAGAADAGDAAVVDGDVAAGVIGFRTGSVDDTDAANDSGEGLHGDPLKAGGWAGDRRLAALNGVRRTVRMHPAERHACDAMRTANGTRPVRRMAVPRHADACER